MILPSFGDDVIAVHYTSNCKLSSEHKDDETIHARHITTKKRENMGAKLTQNSVSNTFHQQFRNENNVETFKRGNFTNLISQQTLGRIQSDFKSRERFSNDDSMDILETQQYFRSILPDDLAPGYVQYIVQDPFIIHLYTKKQIEIFR